jgi:type II secretory pathway pseudopilin PulG
MSLVEVLVLVAVVALLIAMLMPRMARLRALSRRTACLANTGKMSLGAQQYMKDFNAFIVLDQAQLNETADWMKDLEPYGNDERLRQCGEANGDASRPGTADKPWRWPEPTRITTGAYAYNGWLYDPVRLEVPERVKKPGNDLDVDNPNRKKFWTKTTVTVKTARIPVFFDAIWTEALPEQTDTVADLYIGTYTGDTNQMGRIAIDRHKKEIDVSFLDGHSETVSIPNLWTLEWNAQWVTPAELPVVK